MITAWIFTICGNSRSSAGQPKKECEVSQKITVNKQNAEMQDTLKYQRTFDSVSNQKVKPPKTNMRIGKAKFIGLVGTGQNDG